jgi:hypothetical protein
MGRAALLAFSCIALGLFVCTGDEVFDLSGSDEDPGKEQKFKTDWQRMHKEARETIQSQKSSEKSHKQKMKMLKNHTGHKAHNAAIERGVKKAAVNKAALKKVKNALATATKCQDVDMEGFSTKPVNLAKSAQDPGLDLKCGKIRDGKFEYKFRVGRCKPGRLGGTKYFISGINVCGVVSSRTKMAGGSAKRGSKKCVDIWEGANCAGAVAHGSCRFRRIETMCCASCKRAPGKTQLIGTPMAQLNDIVLASSACSGTECLESKAFVFTAFSNHVNSFIPAMQANMMELGGCFSNSDVNRTKPLCPGPHHMLTAKSSSSSRRRARRRAARRPAVRRPVARRRTARRPAARRGVSKNALKNLKAKYTKQAKTALAEAKEQAQKKALAKAKEKGEKYRKKYKRAAKSTRAHLNQAKKFKKRPSAGLRRRTIRRPSPWGRRRRTTAKKPMTRRPAVRRPSPWGRRRRTTAKKPMTRKPAVRRPPAGFASRWGRRRRTIRRPSPWGRRRRFAAKKPAARRI